LWVKGATAVRVGCHGGTHRAPWLGGGGRPAVDARLPRARLGLGDQRERAGGRPPAGTAARTGEGGEGALWMRRRLRRAARRWERRDATVSETRRRGACDSDRVGRTMSGGGNAGHHRWCAAACTLNARSLGKGGAARRRQRVGRPLHRRRSRAPSPPRHPGVRVGGRRHNNNKQEERQRTGGRGGTVRPPPAGAKAGRLPRDPYGAWGGGAPTLQENLPGISRVLGTQNPGLTKEKTALKQASGTINAPAFPG